MLGVEHVPPFLAFHFEGFDVDVCLFVVLEKGVHCVAPTDLEFVCTRLTWNSEICIFQSQV